MVTLSEQKQQVLSTLHKYFTIYSDQDVIVNDDLSVTVQGDVHPNRKRPFPDHHIPVKFDQVQNMYMDSTHLTSFQNSPRIIHKNAWFQQNPIQSLDHAPDHVGGYFGIFGTQIQDLTGLPEGINILSLNYLPHMPLLRTLQVQLVEFPHVNHQPPEPVVQILKNYAGTGRSGAIKCAIELIKAGYKDNARW